MPIANLQQIVRQSIIEALEACSPAEAPFLVLREAGVVAQIRSTLLKNLGPNQDKVEARLSVKAKRKDGRPTIDWSRHPGDPPDLVETLRVQLEMRAFKGEMGERGESKVGRTDLVVLRDRVELFCWSDGPGDIVSLVSVDHVACFVEVKASPSLNLGEVDRYAKDINRLLGMLEPSVNAPASQSPPFAFFVLVDKSIPHFGRHVERVAPRYMDWGGNEAADRCLSTVLNGHSKFQPPKKVSTDVLASIAGMGVNLTNQQPSVPYVEVLAVRGFSASGAARRYAYRRTPMTSE